MTSSQSMKMSYSLHADIMCLYVRQYGLIPFNRPIAYALTAVRELHDLVRNINVTSSCLDNAILFICDRHEVRQ